MVVFSTSVVGRFDERECRMCKYWDVHTGMGEGRAIQIDGWIAGIAHSGKYHTLFESSKSHPRTNLIRERCGLAVQMVRSKANLFVRVKANMICPYASISTVYARHAHQRSFASKARDTLFFCEGRYTRIEIDPITILPCYPGSSGTVYVSHVLAAKSNITFQLPKYSQRRRRERIQEDEQQKPHLFHGLSDCKLSC